MRNAWKALLFLTVLVAGFATPAAAGVPKVLFHDDFGYPT